MEPENSGGPVAAYIDGVGVVIGRPLPEITPDYSAGDESAAAVMESLADMSKAVSGTSVTMEVAAEGIQEIFDAVELTIAVWLAQTFRPKLANRYRHTKKKRIRKKYEKRIIAWFREVLR